MRLRSPPTCGSDRSTAVASVALAILVSAVLACSSGGLPVGADHQPNIVVFLTDDQTVEQVRVMSAVKELLIDRGVSFDNSVVNYATCCPSRATLLTGQHALNHGVLWNAGETGGYQNFQDQQTTLPVALQEAGYRTIFIGKYLNGYGLPPEGEPFGDRVEPPPGWTDYRGLISPTEVLYLGSSFAVNGEIETTGPSEYVTDEMTTMAADALAAAAGDTPFFATVAYPAPHSQAGLPLDEFDWSTFLRLVNERYPDVHYVPPVPAARHAGTMAGEAPPSGPSINEVDVSDKPALLQYPVLGAAELQQMAGMYQAALESLLAVDESIAGIVTELERLGELDDTYLVFTSDNGYLLGQHRFPPGKYFPYDEALRVPLVIAGPGVERGARRTSLVSNVDLAPTVLAMAGVAPLRPPDGRSLVDLLRDEDEPWDRAVFIEGHAPARALAFSGPSPQFAGVRTATSVYVEYDDGSRELYDLVADPAQLTNLAADPEHADTVERHRGWLDQLRTCTGAPCSLVGSDGLSD